MINEMICIRDMIAYKGGFMGRSDNLQGCSDALLEQKR